MTDAKLYRLQNSPGYFYAGHLKDQTQVLMGFEVDQLVALLFDREGRYLRSLTREFSQEIKGALAQDMKQANTKTQSEGAERKDWLVLIWEELDRWGEELGFVVGTIAVQKFSLPEFDMSILDLPYSFQEIVDSDVEIDEDTREQFEYWKASNHYIFDWGSQYEIDSEGEVMST